MFSCRTEKGAKTTPGVSHYSSVRLLSSNDRSGCFFPWPRRHNNCCCCCCENVVVVAASLRLSHPTMSDGQRGIASLSRLCLTNCISGAPVIAPSSFPWNNPSMHILRPSSSSHAVHTSILSSFSLLLNAAYLFPDFLPFPSLSTTKPYTNTNWGPRPKSRIF